MSVGCQVRKRNLKKNSEPVNRARSCSSAGEHDASKIKGLPWIHDTATKKYKAKRTA